MLCAARVGVFLAVLALVAGREWSEATGCDNGSKVCGHDDLQRKELQGLELLQTQLVMQDDQSSDMSTQTETREAQPPQVGPKSTAASNAAPSEASTKAVTVAATPVKENHVQERAVTVAETQVSENHVHERLGSQMSQETRKYLVIFSAGMLVFCVASYLIGPFKTLLCGSHCAEEKARGTSGAAGQLLPRPQARPQAAASSNMPSIPEQLLLPTPKSGGPARSQRSNRASPHGCDGPPVICPSLILPHTEARFMIPIESIMRASGELDILSTSGRKLLDGSVTKAPDGRRRLAIASKGCEGDPRISILADPPTSFEILSGGSAREGGFGTMEIFSKGGIFYGTLEPSGVGGGAVLVCGPQRLPKGRIVMYLEAGVDFRMTASSADGRLLASAGQKLQVATHRTEDDHDTWKVQVKPGVDALLVTACMLGVLLFAERVPPLRSIA